MDLSHGWSRSDSDHAATRLERLLLLLAGVGIVWTVNIIAFAGPIILGRVSALYDEYLPRLRREKRANERAVLILSWWQF